MEEEKYFVIRASGRDTYVECYTEENLLKEFNQQLEEEIHPPEFLTAEDLIKNNNINYWPAKKILIIKGTLVIPEQIKTIVEFGFPK